MTVDTDYTMSAKSPEEEAGYTRFTVVLSSETVKDIDILKALGERESRNSVIQDAIRLLDQLSQDFASVNRTNPDNVEKVFSLGLMRLILSPNLMKYWQGYSRFMEKTK